MHHVHSSPHLHKKSEHDVVEEPQPPTDPARGGLDDQLLGLFLKNYDIISAIADIDRADSPLVTRARIPAAHSARDSPTLPFGRSAQTKPACAASLAVPSLRVSRSTGNLSEGNHTLLGSGDEQEAHVSGRPRWNQFRDRLFMFYSDVRGALAETKDDAMPSRGNDSPKLSAYILRRDLKRCLYESHDITDFVAGVREILIWRNPIASMAMFFVYMYCLFHGWLVPMFLFVVLLQLSVNYLHTQKEIDLGLSLLPRRETPMPRVELSGAQLVFYVARLAQVLLTFLADILEKTRALFTWKNPDISLKFFAITLTFFLASVVFSNGFLLTLVGFCCGIKAFVTTYLIRRFPRLRDLLDVTHYFYSRLPTSLSHPKSAPRDPYLCSLNVSGIRYSSISCGLPLNVDLNEKFEEVNSRLTLLTNKKYVVTIGELLRRINPPELLNSSILGGYLRRAKKAGTGTKLRREFKQRVGVDIKEGRRKTEKQNSFTPLVEQEAAELATDYKELSMRSFPREQLARSLLRGSQLVDIQSFYSAISVVRKAIEILDNDRSPGSKRGEENLKNPTTAHPDDPLWVAVTKGLTDYSLRTHGFGVAAHQTAWQSLAGVFETCIALMSQNPMLPGGFQMPGWNHTFPGAYPANFMGFNPAAVKSEPPRGYQ